MPDFKTHCKISFGRTGKDFAELHKWMDEGAKYLGEDHRFERHSGAYIEYVKKTWGTDGVKEFLNHIIVDYQDTLKKYEGVCIQCGKATWHGKPLCNKCYRENEQK